MSKAERETKTALLQEIKRELLKPTKPFEAKVLPPAVRLKFLAEAFAIATGKGPR